MKIFSHKSILLLFAVFIVFVCTSCFEIIEEVNLNEDGSGSFCFTINLSQSKLNINSMLLLDSINGHRVPNLEDVKKALEEAEAKLKEDGNLSDVKSTKNWDDYIFSVSGNFKNINALNKAINNMGIILNKTRGESPVIQDNFSYSNKIFARLYNYNHANDYKSLSEKDKLAFSNAKYTTIYRFKTLIVSYSNSDAIKSKSGKAVMLKLNVKDLLTNNKTIKNTINLN
jgi:hypothetical protein